MSSVEALASRPQARWLMPSPNNALKSLDGDPFPFSPEGDHGMYYASLEEGMKGFFLSRAREIDWRYGDQRFHMMVDDALFLNRLLSVALFEAQPLWDETLMDRLHTPRLEDEQLQFMGYGFGGSFRAAIASPERYGAVARVHQRLLGRLPDMMDMDRKLPLAEAFEPLLTERLLPAFLRELVGHYEQIPIDPADSDIVFQGVMSRSADDHTPQSLVIVRIVRYVQKTVLEVRLSDVRNDSSRFPDFTIHMTNYERDLRVGPQMPASMNTVIPLYFYGDAQEGHSHLSDQDAVDSLEWMVVPAAEWDKMRKSFVHPEVIAEPIYQTTEEAVHAGLRAIAERMQHLGVYQDPNVTIPLSELLYGDWWIRYREELLGLLRDKKTELSVLGRENGFLTSEIQKLYTRLLDFDAELFFRMAVPMGIMDALEPDFHDLLSHYGYMLYESSFSFGDPEHVDCAITLCMLQYPLWRGRIGKEAWRIIRPDVLGSEAFFTILAAYKERKKQL